MMTGSMPLYMYAISSSYTLLHRSYLNYDNNVILVFVTETSEHVFNYSSTAVRLSVLVSNNAGQHCRLCYGSGTSSSTACNGADARGNIMQRPRRQLPLHRQERLVLPS